MVFKKVRTSAPSSRSMSRMISRRSSTTASSSVIEVLSELGRKPAHIAVRDEGSKVSTGLARHLLGNPLQPSDQAPDGVLPVAVVPDVLDNLGDGASARSRFVGGNGGGVLEIGEEGSVETVKDREVGLVGQLFPFTGPATEHLLKQDAGFHRAQEDDEFQIRYIHTGGKEIDRDGNGRFRPVAKFPDTLQGTVHRGAAGDLLDELLAATEDFPGHGYQFIGMGGVGQIVVGKDERLGKTAKAFFVGQGILLDLFEDFPVGIRNGDDLFDGRGLERPLIFQPVQLLIAGGGINNADQFSFLQKKPRSSGRST